MDPLRNTKKYGVIDYTKQHMCYTLWRTCRMRTHVLVSSNYRSKIISIYVDMCSVAYKCNIYAVSWMHKTVSIE